MGEEGKVDNVNWNNEGKSKHKNRKDKEMKKSAIGAEEAHNANTAKTAEYARMSENEGVSEVTRDLKRDKEEKKKKKNKNKGVEDAEAGRTNDSKEDELNVVFGENGGGRTMDNSGRNGESCSGVTMDNAERKRKKIEKNKNTSDKFEMHDTEEVKRDECISWPEEESVSRKESGKEVVEVKKKHKVKRNNNKEGEKDGEVTGTLSENCRVNATEIRKKRKKGEKTSKDYNGAKPSVQQENVEDRATKQDGNAKTNHERKKKKKHKKKENFEDEKKKNKISENGCDYGRDNEIDYAKKGKKRKTGLVVNGSDDTSPNKSNKKVRFSGQDEFFPVPSNLNDEKVNGEENNMVIGKRFTLEEDEIVKDAVMKYIEDHELGDGGLDMILNCSKHPELKGCWKEIASSIPYRPYVAVYNRARILFMRSENRKWTQEEYDMVLKHQELHGNKWRALADELGKHTWHVKDAWRRIKLPNKKKGHWSQKEYQKLFDLVNVDIQMKISEEKKSKHGMLRDNICWTAISDELSTRPQATCCLKWYKQLTSSMVAEGVWADSDDYRLLSALYSLDATCMEDVDWDDIIDDRSGDLCRKRWNQMVLHIGHHGNKSFAEQVDILAKRYCPHLLEAREIWDSKPRVP